MIKKNLKEQKSPPLNYVEVLYYFVDGNSTLLV